ncbi:hypothetical protein ACJX0J_028807, partial [Zea mays]
MHMHHRGVSEDQKERKEQRDRNNLVTGATGPSGYFNMYATEATMWVQVATMHFVGVADRWLHELIDLLHHCVLIVEQEAFVSFLSEIHPWHVEDIIAPVPFHLLCC